MAIAIAAVLAFALVVPGDIELLAGVYAFGALLAIAIAHLSVIRLRVTDPDRERPYRVPLDVTVRGHRLPLPAMVAAVITMLAWVSVIAFHGGALWLGGGWMIVRAGRVRGLPAVGREHVADEAGDGAGARR